ncbi:MAG: ABC transporter substrate-binding protein [Coleofasciculus sp. S288]|nr:ABC transporter substrate-binding protein [Coleofasciculus sp. S288]
MDAFLRTIVAIVGFLSSLFAVLDYLERHFPRLFPSSISRIIRFFPLPRSRWGRLGVLVASVAVIIFAIFFWREFFPQTLKGCPTDLISIEHISCGEKNLGEKDASKQLGVDAFKTGLHENKTSAYEEAVNYFLESRHNKNKSNYKADPETLIYLNNAQLAAQGIEAYTVVVVVPVTARNESVRQSALEIIRGVAQVQEEVNWAESNNWGEKYDKDKKLNGINGKGLRVLIGDDADDSEQAKKVAKILVNELKRYVLAAIGHFSSGVTKAVSSIYQDELVLISPTSTSEDIQTGKFIFRTVPSNRFTSEVLANYLAMKGIAKAAIFYRPGKESSYSESLRKEFSETFSRNYISKCADDTKLGQRGEVLYPEDELYQFKPGSSNSFDVQKAVDKVSKEAEKETVALVLLPDGESRSQAIDVIRATRIDRNRQNLIILGGDSLYNNEPTLTRVTPEDEAGKDLVVAASWHCKISTNSRRFCEQGTQLWGGEVSWRTAQAHDAMKAIETALKQAASKNRQGVQKALARDNHNGQEPFKANGVTGAGKISFEKGNRANPLVYLTKVIECKSSNKYGFALINSDKCNSDPD